MAALDFPAAPSDGQTYSPAGSSITYTYSSAKGSWQGSLSGTSSSVPSQVALTATNTTDATHYPTFVDTATGNEEIRTDTGLTYNPSSGILTSTTFAGNLTGDVTGTIQTASQTNITAVGIIATGTWSATAVGSQYGGTGQDFSSSTGAILVSSGTMSAGTVSSTYGGTGQDFSSSTGAILVSSGTMSVGTISSEYGGTGQDFSSSTGILSVSSGTMSVTAALDEALGGTGETSYNTGDILYASGSTNLNRLSVGTSGYALKVDVGGTLPEWGVLGVAGGGTGIGSFGATGELLYSTAVNTTTSLPIGSAYQVLQINSGTTAPEWVNGPYITDDTTTDSTRYITFADIYGAANSGRLGDLNLTYNPLHNRLNIGTAQLSDTEVAKLWNEDIGSSHHYLLMSETQGAVSDLRSDSALYYDKSIDMLYVSNLQVSGNTTTVETTNMTVTDKLLELATGTTGSPADDVGLIFERGDYDNVFMGYDESEDRISFGYGTFTGASTGGLSFSSDVPIYFPTGYIGDTAGAAIHMQLGSDAQGDVYYRNSSGYLERIGIGAAGQVFTVNSGGNYPEWAAGGGGGGGTPGGSNTQLQFNDNSVFGGMSEFTYSLPTLTVNGGTIVLEGSSRISIGNSGSATDASLSIEDRAATDFPHSTLGMRWYDSTYSMFINPESWASNNTMDHAICLPTWSVDLNMFSLRNNYSLTAASATHNSSNGKHIYILTDEYSRTGHNTGSDSYNIFIGHDVERGGQSNYTNKSIVMGYQAKYNATSGGDSNIIMGDQTAYGMMFNGGMYNFITGYRAAYTDGGYQSYNIIMGAESWYEEHNGSSNYNIVMGYQSNYVEDTGSDSSYNISMGYQSAYGHSGQPGYSAYNCDYNISMGYQSAYRGFSGHKNISLGYWSMYDSRGIQNMSQNPDRNSCNIAIGEGAMYYVMGGQMYGSRTPPEFGRQYNVAIGYYAGRGTSSSSYNYDAYGVYIGYEAGYEIGGEANVDGNTSDQYTNTRGAKNVFIGYKAGRSVDYGKGNVIIGNYAGSTGTSFNEEVHIYSGLGTERMKIDSSGLTVNGAAVGGGGASPITSTGVLGESYRGAETRVKLTHIGGMSGSESDQEWYPDVFGDSNQYDKWGEYNNNYGGHNEYLWAVPPPGHETAKTVLWDTSSWAFTEKEWSWSDISSNPQWFYWDVGPAPYSAGHVYMSWDGWQYNVYGSTTGPMYDTTNKIWRENGGDQGTWLGTFSKENNATRMNTAVAWQPQGPITMDQMHGMYPACISYSSSNYYSERIMERSTNPGQMMSYWQDGSMPPGTYSNSTMASDWLTWTTSNTYWTHVYDMWNIDGYQWDGSLIFHPRAGTPIEIECDIVWNTNDVSENGYFAMKVDNSSNYWTSGWGGTYWLNDYNDMTYGTSQSGTTGDLKYTRLKRILYPRSQSDSGQYKWSPRHTSDYYPWLVGLWAKCESDLNTLTIYNYTLRAKFYA